jgi:hypothetical protein
VILVWNKLKLHIHATKYMLGIQMKFIALKSALLIIVITVSGCASTDSKAPKLASQQTQSHTLESNMSQAPPLCQTSCHPLDFT